MLFGIFVKLDVFLGMIFGIFVKLQDFSMIFKVAEQFQGFHMFYEPWNYWMWTPGIRKRHSNSGIFMISKLLCSCLSNPLGAWGWITDSRIHLGYTIPQVYYEIYRNQHKVNGIISPPFGTTKIKLRHLGKFGGQMAAGEDGGQHKTYPWYSIYSKRVPNPNL